jgi:hypothetical protein
VTSTARGCSPSAPATPGCDLALDVANARLESTISIRRGQMFQPKAVFGRPRAEIGWLSKLPVRVNERIARVMTDVVIGPARAYRGLPEPATRNLNELPPVVNNLLPYWIQHGRIDVAPGVARLDGRRVHFADGTSREFDTILWATGFKASLPFLDNDLVRTRDGVPLRTAGLTLPVGAENLYLIGLAAPRGPQLPVYSLQTELVARMIRLHPDRRSALAARFAESIFGVTGSEGYIAYTASKAAIIAMTKTAALEHAGDRIRVNAICPGRRLDADERERARGRRRRAHAARPARARQRDLLSRERRLELRDRHGARHRRRLSGALDPRAPEDVGEPRLERGGTELDPVAALDGEAGRGDGAARVAREVAAGRERRPRAAAVGELEERALGLPPREHVLVEAQLAAGAQHAPQLGERPTLVGDAAEDEADDRGVQRSVRERQVIREARHHGDRDGGRPGGHGGERSQGRLRLDG